MGSGLGHCPAHRKTPPMHLPTPWPYPRWIAHRGAGLLAPENTLAPFPLGPRHGYRMFECDAKLSRDGVPFLLHDTTLERTTNSVQALGQGASRTGGDHRWRALSRLDAGAWHSPRYAGVPLPTLENLARYCIANGFFLNLEIKPTPGLLAKTGQVVGAYAARLWQGQPAQPLLSSFHPEALAGALATAPHLPRALLLDALWGGGPDCAPQPPFPAPLPHPPLSHRPPAPRPPPPSPAHPPPPPAVGAAPGGAGQRPRHAHAELHRERRGRGAAPDRSGNVRHHHRPCGPVCACRSRSGARLSGAAGGCRPRSESDIVRRAGHQPGCRLHRGADRRRQRQRARGAGLRGMPLFILLH